MRFFKNETGGVTPYWLYINYQKRLQIINGGKKRIETQSRKIRKQKINMIPFSKSYSKTTSTLPIICVFFQFSKDCGLSFLANYVVELSLLFY